MIKEILVEESFVKHLGKKKNIYPKHVPYFRGIAFINENHKLKNIVLRLGWRTSHRPKQDAEYIIQHIWKGFPIPYRNKVDKVCISAKGTSYGTWYWEVYFGW